jgi:hypothetical protein
VQKARSSGRLVLHPDGSIDAAASDAHRRQATDPAKQRSDTPSPWHGYKPVPEAAVGAVSETLKEQGVAASGSRDAGNTVLAKKITSARQQLLFSTLLKSSGKLGANHI